MSVIEVIEPDFEFWQNSIDPGLPEGVWRAFGRATGDATGGFLLLQLDFQKQTDPLSSRMWSLEMLAATADLSIAQLGVTATNLGEVLGAAPLTGTGYVMSMANTDGQNELLQGRDLAFLPWFLGAPRNQGVQAGIGLRTGNTNLMNLDVWMRGFVWGPRSQNVEGGPRRPLGSVFGK